MRINLALNSYQHKIQEKNGNNTFMTWEEKYILQS